MQCHAAHQQPPCGYFPHSCEGPAGQALQLGVARFEPASVLFSGLAASDSDDDMAHEVHEEVNYLMGIDAR